MIRVSSPEELQIQSCLEKIAKYEKFELPREISTRISNDCDGNLRKAILILEAMYVQQYPFQSLQEIPKTDWEKFIQSIATLILKDQTPKKYFSINSLLEIRTQLYQLLANCIPPQVIIKTLCFDLVKMLDVEMQKEVIQVAAEYVF
jgi:replication factor C subunit 3/5